MEKLNRKKNLNPDIHNKFIAYCKSLPPEKLQKNPFNFRGSNLEGLHGPRFYLPYANFFEVYLPWADFSNAILFGANLSRASLPHANLSGAIVDEGLDKILQSYFPDKNQQNWIVVN